MKQKPKSELPTSTEEMASLVRNLRLRLAELEKQNEQLQRAQLELEQAKSH